MSCLRLVGRWVRRRRSEPDPKAVADAVQAALAERRQKWEEPSHLLEAVKRVVDSRVRALFVRRSVGRCSAHLRFFLAWIPVGRERRGTLGSMIPRRVRLALSMHNWRWCGVPCFVSDLLCYPAIRLHGTCAYSLARTHSTRNTRRVAILSVVLFPAFSFALARRTLQLVPHPVPLLTCSVSPTARGLRLILFLFRFFVLRWSSQRRTAQLTPTRPPSPNAWRCSSVRCTTSCPSSRKDWPIRKRRRRRRRGQ